MHFSLKGSARLHTKDFFALFDGFEEFVDFFHFQDLVTPDYKPFGSTCLREIRCSRDTGPPAVYARGFPEVETRLMSPRQ